MKKAITSIITDIASVTLVLCAFWIIAFGFVSPKEKLSALLSADNQNVTLDSLGYRFYSPSSTIIFNGQTKNEDSEDLSTSNVQLYFTINKDNSFVEKVNDKIYASINFSFTNIEFNDYFYDDIDVGWVAYVYDSTTGEILNANIIDSNPSFDLICEIPDSTQVSNLVIAFAPHIYDLNSNSGELIDIKKTKIALISISDVLL